MSREVNRNISRIILAGIGIFMASGLQSCSGNGDEAKAKSLLDAATEAYEQGRYAESLELTDSLKRAYPAQIDLRRQALHLATRATEGLTLRRLEQADSLLAVCGVRGDSLTRLVRFVQNPIEGYYVAKDAKTDNFVGTNGIQARVSPEGNFYITSSLKAKRVNSTSVAVSNGSESASTAVVAYDGERNDRSMGAEVITFIEAECDTLGRFITQHRAEPLTLTFNGDTSYSMPLTASQADEIATVYEYASTVRQAKVANLERERLSRALDISRAQAAKTFVEPENEK